MSDNILAMAELAMRINGPVLQQAREMRSAEIKARREQNARNAAAFVAAKNQTGRVYFAECGDFIKIGYTAQSVEDRIAIFTTGNPLPITLLLAVKGTQTFEKSLHKRFAALRHHGEWFKKQPELLALIEELRTAKA